MGRTLENCHLSLVIGHWGLHDCMIAWLQGWGDGMMGEWGNGVLGRWGDGENVGELSLVISHWSLGAA
jgi:hypothetical protein